VLSRVAQPLFRVTSALCFGVTCRNLNHCGLSCWYKGRGSNVVCLDCLVIPLSFICVQLDHFTSQLIHLWKRVLRRLAEWELGIWNLRLLGPCWASMVGLPAVRSLIHSTLITCKLESTGSTRATSRKMNTLSGPFPFWSKPTSRPFS
jgi:hypothetical protein